MIGSMFGANHPTAIAALSAAAAAHREAVAVLTLDLSGGDGLVQLTPDGVFRARDGRPGHLPGWTISPAIAARVIAKLRARKTPIVVDYEHQTLNADTNGQPAPAAGWIDPATVEYRPGAGLFAAVAWTTRAKGMIDAGEYKFLSPVLPYDVKTGEVLDLLHVALTNFPAVDGMAPVAALAARYQLDPEDDTVKREQLIALLGLAADATDEQISTALAALKAKADQADTLQTEVTALKAKTPAEPDPAKYVPVGVVSELQAELVALKARTDEKDKDALIQQGLDDGKLVGEAHVAWARSLDVAALKTYLEKAPAVAALRGSQTGGKGPAGDGDGALYGDAAAVARQFGNSAEDLKKYGGAAV